MTTTRDTTPATTTPPGATPGGVELVKAPPPTVTPWSSSTLTTTPGTTIATSPTTNRGWRSRQWMRARRIASATTTPATLTTAARRATSPTLRAARLVARHSWIVGRGLVSWVERAARGATHGYHREQVRLARAAGNTEQQKEWANLLREERNDRIDRLAQLPKVILGLLFAFAVAVGITLAVLLVAALLALILDGAAGWSGWWAGVGATITALRDAAVWLWRVATTLVLPVAGILAWREGKRRFDPPMWLLAPEQRTLVDAEITPSRVVIAFRDLGIAKLRQALKDAEDAGGGMLSAIAGAGPGVEVDVLLPSGVSTKEVQDRRQKLAENLGRREHELYITLPPGVARTVRLWIANPGALDEPVGPSPMVLDPKMRVDFRSGRAPWGRSLRDLAVTVALWQRHLLITGLSNEGKTASLRALALWAAHDVKVKFRIGDLKGVGDWSMFGGIAEVLIEGPTDSHVVAVTEMLEDVVAEQERRLEAGERDADPLIAIVDEAQVAYMCPAVGPDRRPYGGASNNSRYLTAVRKIQNQGRGVNVILWQGTQNPTNQNLPVLAREGAMTRISLVVGSDAQSRMALPDRAVDGGAAPHLLRPGLDKGVVVGTGDAFDLPAGEASITVRTHYIDDTAAKGIATRVIERRRKAGRLVSSAGVATAPEVDHLADIHEAMQGEQRVRTVVVLGRLIEQNAAVYEPWGSDDLAAAVRQYVHLGLDIRKSDGQSVLRLDEVSRALRDRE